MAELESIVKRIAHILNDIKLRYVIVGGFATILRGRPRTTTDLDLIIENNPEKVQIFLNALKKADFDVMDDQVRMAMAENANATIFDNHSPLRIDLKVAKKKEDQVALASATYELYEGVNILVASIEQILHGKVLYLGDISNIPDSELLEYQDARDFVNVFREQRDKINLNVLEEKARAARLIDTLKRLIAEATRKHSKQKTLF